LIPLRWRLHAGAIAVLTLALCSAPAIAEDAPKKAATPLNPLLETCLRPADAQTVILACTTAIESRQLQGESLAAALYNRGRALGARGQIPAAVNDFSSALKLVPDATNFLYGRAAAYGMMRRHDLAIADYDALLKLDPKDFDARYQRAWSLAALGRDEPAVADLTALLEVVKDDIDALMDRGGLYLRLGQFDKAAADFSAIIKLDPKAAAAFYNRGRARFLGGDFKAATKDFAQAQALRADNPYAALRRYLANGQGVGDGKSKINPEILTEAMAKFAPEQWPLPVLATLAGKLPEKDLLSAAAIADKGVARRLDAETHYYLGEAALLKKDTKAARAHFAAAAKGDRGTPEVVDAGWRLKGLP